MIEHASDRDCGLTTVEVVVPVYNEEQVLAGTIARLKGFLSQQDDFQWCIGIISNGSTDGTRDIGERLSREDERVSFVHIHERGRGGALRKKFLESRADVCIYVDADLSVDVSILPELVRSAAINRGVVIANRLDPSARAKRPRYRIFLSCAYNLLVRLFFPRSSIKDPQVGMKAFHSAFLKRFIPQVKSNNFFFDTELLLLAEYNACPIVQIPADCCDLRLGKVNFAHCILELFCGLVRVRYKRTFLLKR